MWTTCCGCMLWVTVTYVVENMFTNVAHNIHNMYPTTCPLFSTLYVHTLHSGYIVGACCGQHLPMLWMTCSRMLSTTYTCSPQHMICCGSHVPFFKNFQHVPHNIHPQYIKLSTTYTHNICPLICCGCMLWRTTSICCGAHMLWSATTSTDVVGTACAMGIHCCLCLKAPVAEIARVIKFRLRG